MINNNIRSGIYDGRNYCIDLSTIQPVKLEDIKNEPTVYGISGIWSNISINSSLYLGSSIETRHRIVSNHVNYLNKNKHDNIHLQHAFNKHGIQKFEFFIFEKCKKGEELIREQNWLDFYNDNYDGKPLFNISKVADKPILTLEGRLKCSKTLRNKMAKEWVVTNPNGDEIKVFSLKRFCIQNNLITNAMYMVARKEISQHKGWKCRYFNETCNQDNPRIFKKSISKKWVITFPNNKTKIINNLAKFCRDNNLNIRQMLKVSSNKIKSYKNFKCKKYE